MTSSRHLEERSPNARARSPRRGVDSYRPTKQGRPSPEHSRDAPVPSEMAEKTEEEKLANAKAEYQKLLSLRSGGTYIPPHRLRALQAQIGDDKQSKEYQRMHWDALKKSINGLINKVNVSNIKDIVPELFSENLIRARGLFVQSLTKAQAASLPFTPIYASVAAIVNTKLPNVGELLAKRLVMRFRKAFKRNDKAVCLSTCIFIAHLTNTRVIHEMLCAQILLLLLAKPTDDSVEIAVGLTKEVGQFLDEMNPQICRAIFDQYRVILNEAAIEPRSQYMVETLFQIRKDKFKDNPAIKEELDLVEEEDQITHKIYLDEEIDTMDTLNIFKYDDQFEAHEEEYNKLKAEILGEGSDDDDDDDEDDDDEGEDESEDEEEQKKVEIQDMSNAELVNLRRKIYLTHMSSATPEEAVHKFMKLKLPPGKEAELVSMVIESCAQERTYLKFYGLIAENLCRINRLWTGLFEEEFTNYYTTIHRFDNNKLRNLARFFGHLFAADQISWHCLGTIHLNEDETTAASRIFIKFLFEAIQEDIGTAALAARLGDKTLLENINGLFPHDNPRNIRFAINYFTSIKMGYLTEEMRTFLQNMPKPALLAAPAHDSDSDSVSSYSSYTGSSYSSRSHTASRSRSPPPRQNEQRGRTLSRTPPRRYRDQSYDSRSRSRSRTGSISPRRSMSRTPSRSPARRSRYRDSRSASPRSARPAMRGRSYSRSISRSPIPSHWNARLPSRSPLRRPRRRDSRSASPRSAQPAVRGRSYSRSVSRSSAPLRRNTRGRGRSVSYNSRSPPSARRRPRDSESPRPARRRANSSSVSPSPPRSPEIHPSRRINVPMRDKSPVGAKRRRYSSDGSRSRSPVPVKRGRRSS